MPKKLEQTQDCKIDKEIMEKDKYLKGLMERIKLYTGKKMTAELNQSLENEQYKLEFRLKELNKKFRLEELKEKIVSFERALDIIKQIK